MSSSHAYTASIIIISDSRSIGVANDKTTPVLTSCLKEHSFSVSNTLIVADEVTDIQEAVKTEQVKGTRLIVTSGGTGIGPRDVTPEAVLPLLDLEIPGLAECMRLAGSKNTSRAWLSRSFVGVIKDTLVVGVPGSPKGAVESLDAIASLLHHTLNVREGASHDNQLGES